MFGKGRDGLWKDLQEIYGETSTAEKKTSNNKEPGYWKQTKSQRAREKLGKAQHESREVIKRYQDALFPNNNNNKTKSQSLPALLNNLHELCVGAVQDNESLVVSMDTLLDTEDQFRDLGKLVRQLMTALCRPSNVDNATDVDDDGTESNKLAEELLRALIQLKEDRALLVKRAKESLRQQTIDNQDSGWTGWFKRIFVLSPGEGPKDEKSTPEEQALMAHEEPSFGPTRRQFLQVMKSIQREGYAHKWEYPDRSIRSSLDAIQAETKVAREGLLQCANRMTALLDLLPSQNVPPFASLISIPMKTFAQVGSLEAASEVKRIYSDICNKKVPRDLFHVVLQAYRLAALMEYTLDARAEAATTAIALLQEREHYSLASSYYKVPGTDDPRGESYAIVIETVEKAGFKALPERISLAENLLKLYLGEKIFNQVVDYREELRRSKVDMQVFESLLLMYAFKGGEHKFVKRAKNILECAEDQLTESKAPEKAAVNASDTDKEMPTFPNSKSYNAVLTGIRMNIKRILDRIGQAKNESEVTMARNIIKGEVADATFFLDRMTQTCAPDLRTFELLLQIWAMAKLPESGERADDILSRMNIRQACTGTSDAWSDICRVYSPYLECWAVSPEVSSAGVLHRALRILDKMEAQSGIQFIPLSSLDTVGSKAEKEILGLVYEQSGKKSYRMAYNSALKICSLCQDAPEEAFQAAFAIYNRMISAGVEPDQETFANLFACCFLAGDDDAAEARRQELASTVIAFASDHGLNTRKMTKKMKTFKMRKNEAAKRRM